MKCKFRLPILFWIVGFICVYILFTAIFPETRVLKSILSPNETIIFNHVLEELSVGYLTGIFVYFLTTTLKNRIDRQRRKWELNGLFEDVAYLEAVTNERWDIFDSFAYKQLTEDDVSQLTSKYGKLTNLLQLYSPILTENELDLLSEITTNVAFEPFYPEMSKKEVELNVNRIKTICKDVELLQISIHKLINS